MMVNERSIAGRELVLPLEAVPFGVSLRGLCENDLPFLKQLYRTTRPDIASADLPNEHKALLMDQQFAAQHQHYQNVFPDGEFAVIEQEGSAIGRMYVAENTTEIRLIDIALIPERRGQGIGRALISALQKRAAESKLPLRLRVEPYNPALQLYQRLGFATIADEQVNWHMEWTGSGVCRDEP